MRPDVTRLASSLRACGIEADVAESTLGVVVRVPLGSVRATLETLRAEGFGFLVDLFGHDTGELLDVTYHLRSLSRDDEVFVRAAVAYDGTLPSVWEVFPAAAFPEREAAELLGMRLSGHPNPRRLLTTTSNPPYLRKDQPVRSAEEVRAR